MYDERVHYAHAIILLAWILPGTRFFDMPQFITPFIATVIFVAIDVHMSRGYYPYNDMAPLIGGLNLLGMVVSTADFVLDCYQSSKELYNFQMGFSIKMQAIMDGIYAVAMIVTLLIGYFALFIKKRATARR